VKQTKQKCAPGEIFLPHLVAKLRCDPRFTEIWLQQRDAVDLSGELPYPGQALIQPAVDRVWDVASEKTMTADILRGTVMGDGRNERGRSGPFVMPHAVETAWQARSDDPQQANLAALVIRMAGGDETALGAFYDATVTRVYGLAARICGNTALAEEVAADVYYQCWTQAARYDAARSKVMSWLLMICRSRAINAVRARDPAFAHEAPESLVEDDEQRPRERDQQDLLELVQSGTAVHAALATLSPVQRQMIGLAFFRGFSHLEIAAHAKLPLGTVKSHIRRALELLRRNLEPSEARRQRQR
jgi:RNA polymerase sigma factor (sigma-70 family)